MKFFRSLIPLRKKEAESRKRNCFLLFVSGLVFALTMISPGNQAAQALSPQPGAPGDVFVSIDDFDFSRIVFPTNSCAKSNWNNNVNHLFTPGTPVAFTAIFTSVDETCPTQSEPSSDMGRMFNGWTCTDPSFNTGNFTLNVIPSASGPITCEGSTTRMRSSAVPSNSSALVSWDATTNPNLNHYVVSWFSPDDYSFGYCTNNTSNSFVNCSGLTNGLSYIFNPVGYLDAGGTVSLGQTNSSTVLPPVITSIAPNVGALTGGEIVTITGDGFSPIAGWTVPTVEIGGVLCVNVVVISNTSLTCGVPSHSAGVVDVSVLNSNGGTATAIGAFSYGIAPTPTTSPTPAPSPPSSDSAPISLAYTGIQMFLPLFVASVATLLGFMLIAIRSKLKK